jgi:penicillin-binding protein 1A
MATAKKKKNVTNFSKYVRWFWILFGSGVFAFFMLFQLAAWGVFGDLPTFEELENPKSDLAGQVISSDGKILGTYYIDANRKPIQYKDLPKNLVDALVATEDERFYEHSGIDARGLLRAMAKLGAGGGASTITQQLAKNLFTKKASQNTVKRIVQKVKEWNVAVRLERQYTKEEIIAMYLNTQGFLFKATGIRSASQIYFDKEPKDLDLQESAILVAMLKNPRQFNPHRKISRNKSKARRNVVFAQMARNGLISEQEKDSLQRLPLKIKFTPETHNDGLATYFREYLRDELKKWAEDPNNRKPDGSKYNIYKDGLKIYTTIDSRMQQYAEVAVAQHMPRLQAEFFHQNTKRRNPTAPFLDLTYGAIDTLMRNAIRHTERWSHMKYDLKKSNEEIIKSFDEKTDMSIFAWKDGLPIEIDTIMTPMDSMRYYKHFLRPGMMSMDPQTGHVKVWVGGMNYRQFKYDMVKQGKRQIGSTFKPFVYAAAIDQLHLSPCDTLPRSQITIEANKHGFHESWTPKNSDGNYTGYLTLKQALANSVNTVTARLINEIGPQPVVNLAKNLGVEKDILPVPSIALGTEDLSVYEMVAAYSTFANKGVYTKPVILLRIEDKNKTILYQASPETKDVLSEEAAYVTINLLEGVTKGGSGTRLRHTFAKDQAVYKEIITGYPYEFQNPIAGKTGTTQNQSDGWFMGMVPNLVTGVWVGAEDRAAHFKTITYGQGASMALPIWALFMKSCYADESLNISQEAFEKPEQLSIIVDCEKHRDSLKLIKKGRLDDDPEIDF